MKHQNNNEMDMLLRGLAGGPANVSAEKDVQGNHLDPDEMNAFAEGQVPQRARARYVAHLADCAQCRQIVSTLVQTSGVATAPTDSAVGAKSSSFWTQLTTLFSPAVLRYAVPAVGLAAIMGVLLFAWRQQQDTSFVAQRDTKSDAQVAPNANAQPYSEPKTTPGAPTGMSTANEAPHKTTGPVAAGEKSGIVGGLADTSASAVKEAPPVTTEAPASRNEPMFALEPQAAPPPPPKPADAAETDKLALAKKDEDRERAAVRQAQVYETKTKSDDAFRNRSSDAPATGTVAAPRRRAQGIGAARAREDVETRRGAEVEERSVGGKQFRREGNAWIDTSYSSGRSTVNVSRGSEQYRALIADEPSIRTFAEQLSGEVIVVWKGKAYRIH